MPKSLFSFLAVCLLLAGVVAAHAQQQAPSAPPKILQISREVIKADKGPAHEKQAKHYVQLLAKASSTYYRLALLPVTGDESEVVYLWGFDSFAEVERTSVSQARYMQAVTFRVRPGHEPEFAEAVKIVRAAYEQVNLDVHWFIYQISSGAPGPTFLVFIPRKSLQELDEGLARSKALQEAEGEENAKKLLRIASEAYVNVESHIYGFNPKMSYVSKEFAAEDPDFWTPKAKAVKAAATPTKSKAKLAAKQ